MKVKTREREVYGVAISRIEDFRCYGTTVYCGTDGRCWYASEEFSSERVVGGWGTVEVIGGFELRRLHSDQILDLAPG
jgi:hypothetical protein